MYKIISPNKVTEKAWGLNFVEGVAETENDYLASKLEKKGYKVEHLEPPKEENESDDTPEDDQGDKQPDKADSNELDGKKTSKQKKVD